jgi:hypothetical protein
VLRIELVRYVHSRPDVKTVEMVVKRNKTDGTPEYIRCRVFEEDGRVHAVRSDPPTGAVVTLTPMEERAARQLLNER